VHKTLNRYFKKLREELSKQIAIEARFLLVPDNFLEDIGLDVSISAVDPVGQIIEGPANSDEILAALEHKPLAERLLPELGDSKQKFEMLDDLQTEFLLKCWTTCKPSFFCEQRRHTPEQSSSMPPR
jgi:hypothetical protein